MNINKEFEELYEGWAESTVAYAKSLEKIANDKALKMLSKSERENLKKIAALLDKEKKEEDEAYRGTEYWKKGQKKMKKAGITLQKKDKFSGYVEEVEKEASTYRDKEKDDEKKRKFAFGGKKKSRHGASGYGKGEEVEVDEAKSKLPPHLAKFFDKDGNLKKDAAARVAKGREKINWIDVTPKGYGPKEEVEKQTKLKEKIMDLEDTVKQVIGETNKNDKSDDGDGLDAVQPKAVKKKFKDRKDKDIDNDGDTDDSDKFLHKKRKAISKAINKEQKTFSKMFTHVKSLIQDK